MLGKHLGMFKDKVELSGNVGNPLLESIARQLRRWCECKVMSHFH